MKNKNILLGVFFAFSSTVYATDIANLSDDEINQKTYFCPETITCKKFNQIESCSYKSEDPQYWGDLKVHGFVLGNTYQLDAVSASYHSTSVQPVTCTYSANGYKNYQLSISSKNESNFEVFYRRPTNWVFSDAGDSYRAACSPDANGPKSCPLKIQSALIIYNANIGSGIIASINNKSIRKVSSGQYMKVNYDDALTSCMGIRDCRVNITSSQGIFYGDITIDMYDSMKILNVSSITPLAELNQIGVYNAVEVNSTNYKNKNQ